MIPFEYSHLETIQLGYNEGSLLKAVITSFGNNAIKLQWRIPLEHSHHVLWKQQC